MQQLQSLPPVRWAVRHPRLAAWIVLAAGMSILLIIEARNIGLLVTQWVALILACILVAGACVWIISWEDSDDEDVPATPTPTPETPPVMAAEAVADNGREVA